MRKLVDDRIRTLIENGVKLRHRSMFVIIGDKSRNQIVDLHYMLSKAVIKSRPTVLWCYKGKLEFSSHKKRHAKQMKKLAQRGLLDPEKVDPFSLFVESTNITYCLYKDSERVLGNSFGMCILQDFEALTPNLLARTIETVEGGGLVILLLRSLTSLTSLYTMVMDVHDRFRTESHSKAVARFNERFLLSIASCKACLVVDDELNVLQISSHFRSIQPVLVEEDSEGLSEKSRELKNLKEQFRDELPVGPLIGKSCTMDQCRAIITFLDAILDKTLRSTVALIAARGRGKSAALGLAVAGAIFTGYSNIFVTAPGVENLQTLFEFVCKGLNLLDYMEHLHYNVLKSDDPDMKNVTIQINVFKQHRQTIKYLKPQDSDKFSQVELLVIDEAAAIPLPIVKSLLGPYLVFLSSTVNGYEGTGRSLSLKLLQQLESQSQTSSQHLGNPHLCKIFKKVELHESIRYASNDPIESWLNGLLCLDVANYIPNISRLPHPSKCDLYYVNRDTLFSYHKESELFLQRMMALYVASHYKNSPNDLQLMSDAPSHHLFVLLGPVDESQNQLPDILCVIQVCLEGKISMKSTLQSLAAGHSPSGDQIAWKICQQFQEVAFPSLSGARIVRIAVHPSALRLGYGSAAVNLLTRYYEGQLTDFAEEEVEVNEGHEINIMEAAEKVSLLEEKIKPRSNLPPLLVHLHERHPEKLHYIGVSFGLTQDLFRFWRKHGFVSLYISQIPNAVTGEHTCMVLRPLESDDIENVDSNQFGFLEPCYQDFRKRFSRLLGTIFRGLDYKLAMSILASKIDFLELEHDSNEESTQALRNLFSPYDLERLEAYAKNRVDYHMILDLVPNLAHQYFQGELRVTLSPVVASVLFCIGMQKHDIISIQEAMKLERQQIFAYLKKAVTKLYNYLQSLRIKEIDVKRRIEVMLTSQGKSVDEDLEEAAREVQEKMKADNEGIFNPEHLQRFAIFDRDEEFEKALQGGTNKVSSSGLLSVKSNRSKVENGRHEKAQNKRQANNDAVRSKSRKKKRN
ncbi:hypothetical protein HPP92_008448 [Vanilla planifolia]|uniref:RNA cytidine acetyltransferase n=1 Tax=Vanilla planifolia TaxID=51239 RepID=A0A835R4R0_VANPL|nr:hypothetical protein HPP92_008448 [Vanilla planifolia]